MSLHCNTGQSPVWTPPEPVPRSHSALPTGLTSSLECSTGCHLAGSIVPEDPLSPEPTSDQLSQPPQGFLCQCEKWGVSALES